MKEYSPLFLYTNKHNNNPVRNLILIHEKLIKLRFTKINFQQIVLVEELILTMNLLIAGKIYLIIIILRIKFYIKTVTCTYTGFPNFLKISFPKFSNLICK